MSTKVLIVDDSPTVREIVRALLSSEGYEVVVEPDATKALDVIKEAQPDLLILDIMMPEMDGYTLLRNVRKEKGLESLPVIMLSAKEEEGMRDLFTFEGITGYLEKPFQDEELIGLVNKTLKKN